MTASDILTTDRLLDHISTAPAVAGQPIKLFVREKVRADVVGQGDRVVLMVHGGFWPSTLAFDFPHENYSWMDALARHGWDVFAVDMTGYGPMAPSMDRQAAGLMPIRRGRSAAAELGGARLRSSISHGRDEVTH